MSLGFKIIGHLVPKKTILQKLAIHVNEHVGHLDVTNISFNTFISPFPREALHKRMTLIGHSVPEKMLKIRQISCFDTPAITSPTAIDVPLSVITNLPILCFSGRHMSELHMFTFFQCAPARFQRADLLFSYRPQ